MNKIVVLSAIGASALIIQNGHASLLFSDGFNYTSGDDLGAGSTTPTWTATATPNSNIAIGSANLTYSGLTDLGGNSLNLLQSSTAGVPAYATLSSSITSGSIYYSFLIDCTAVPTSASYLTSLTSSAHPGANGTSTDALAVYAKLVSGATWELGIKINSAGPTYETTVLNQGQDYLAVVEYTFNGATPSAALYLDPSVTGGQPGTSSVSLTGTAAAANPDVSDVSFKAQTAAVGNFIFDNLYVGTTWGDVVVPAAVPEPVTLALAGVGALGLIMARRRR